jgi:Fe-S-cluster containining protein
MLPPTPCKPAIAFARKCSRITRMDRLDSAIRRQLLKDDALFIGKPFELAGDNARGIQANARHLALMLLDTRIDHRASRAAAFAEQLIDMTLSKHVTGPIACAKGCAYCCRTYVSATIPEILHLARAVRGQQAKQQRVAVAAEKSKAMPQLHREIARLDCPMLEDNACSEYVSRPIVCRAVLSQSLETCVRIFQNGSAEKFAVVDNTQSIRAYAVIILRVGLILSGLPYKHYEMNHALTIALNHDDAEERWLAGEPLFAEVAMDRADAQPSQLTQVVDGMAAALRPTI